MEKILIVRLGAMGDVIHGLPAVAALRQRFPHAQIGWVVEARWSEVLQAKGATSEQASRSSRPLVDVVHPAQTRSWRKSALSSNTRNEVLTFFRELRAQRYDVAFDLQGAIKSAVITGFSGALRKMGPRRPREVPAKLFYGHPIASTAKHVVQQYADIASEQAGAADVPRTPQPHLLPVSPSAESWCLFELATRGLTGQPFALLSPGAGWKAKEWPPERYGDLAKRLSEQGITSILNGGPNEIDLLRTIESASDGAAQPVACTIPQLISLTRRAHLFIGGDTGPMHLANLLGVPVVAIFGPTDPERNGPYFGPSIVLRDPRSQSSYSHRDQVDEGLVAISVDQVVEAALRLLGKS
ncbi:MAG TPA: glycosyltransferase family 9 protein [Terriglobales bacterium]|nr:glycosyltransferase family 9 protein [Terriglobales bacterium]